MRTLKMLVWCVFAGMAVTGIGCGSGAGSSVPSAAVSSAPKIYGTVALTVTVPHGNNTRGVGIPITFTAANTGPQTVLMSFGGCDDFTIHISKGVGRSGQDRTAEAVAVSFDTLLPCCF